MEKLIQFGTYLLVGFVEMFLITQRTAFIAKDKRKAAASVVVIENFIAFFIILQLAKDVNNNIPGFLAYTIGSCSGTVLNVDNLTIDVIMKYLKKMWRQLKKQSIAPVTPLDLEHEELIAE